MEIWHSEKEMLLIYAKKNVELNMIVYTESPTFSRSLS
jgi:hypothetical protein